jgi:hypothetical protein
MRVALNTKKNQLKTIPNLSSTLTQIQSFCAWLDREMRVAQNPQLNHVQSPPFAFYSTKALGV